MINNKKNKMSELGIWIQEINSTESLKEKITFTGINEKFNTYNGKYF